MSLIVFNAIIPCHYMQFKLTFFPLSTQFIFIQLLATFSCFIYLLQVIVNVLVVSVSVTSACVPVSFNLIGFSSQAHYMSLKNLFNTSVAGHEALTGDYSVTGSCQEVVFQMHTFMTCDIHYRNSSKISLSGIIPAAQEWQKKSSSPVCCVKMNKSDGLVVFVGTVTQLEPITDKSSHIFMPTLHLCPH